MDETRFLTPPEIKRRLRVDGALVLEWIHSGQLPAINTSRGNRPRWKIDPAALQKFIDERSKRSEAVR